MGVMSRLANPAADSDKALFADHRHTPPPFEIGGLDVAGNALSYARQCGLVSQLHCWTSQQWHPTIGRLWDTRTFTDDDFNAD